MVFEHQTQMTNLLIRAGWAARYSRGEKEAGRQTEIEVSRALDAISEQVVDYMLFIDEDPLLNPIKGTSGFAEKFSAMGPHDMQGRSLRQLDLAGRLFRYPCSYMIYSEAFDHLPPQAQDAIYHRMWTILADQEKTAKYARLSKENRRNILTILRETKPNLPSYFFQ
jgi:hypothetical protein